MRRILLWILVAGVVAAGCGGGGGRNLTPPIASPTGGTVETALPEEGAPERNSLTVVTPSLASLTPGRGELVRVRFRLLAEPPRNFRLRLLNDAAFLQLRDRNGGRLSFDLASEVKPQ